MRQIIGQASERVRDARRTPDASLTVLDVFSGGGTTALSAAQLGHRPATVENNELAAFITFCLVNQSQAHPDLVTLVKRHGLSLLEKLEIDSAKLFPARSAGAIAYFWSRSFRCPSCEGQLSLQKRPWLSQKGSQSLLITRKAILSKKRYRTSIVASDDKALSENAWDGSGIHCPFCKSNYSRAELSSLWATNSFDEATAHCIIEEGKIFKTSDGSEFPNPAYLSQFIQEDLEHLGMPLPDVPLPRWSGIVNPSLYGYSTYADLLNTRQQAVVVHLCRLIREEHASCSELYGKPTADAVAAFLSGLIDQLADWNSRLCMWISQNEQVGRGLSGPGIPMMWDYVEIDPLASGPANLWDKLNRIASGLVAIPKIGKDAIILQGDARDLPLQDRSVDIVAIDPPYYDNLFYSVLADCIYVWKRLALADIFPEFFKQKQSDHLRELSASKNRLGSKQLAHKFYTDGMSDALAEMRRVLRPDGVLAIVFTHSSVDGWSSIMGALKEARIALVDVQEIRVERKRPRSMRSNAIDTCFVLFGASSPTEEQNVSCERFTQQIEAQAAERLLEMPTSQVDAAMTMFGKLLVPSSGLTVTNEQHQAIAQYDVVGLIADVVRKSFPEFELTVR